MLHIKEMVLRKLDTSVLLFTNDLDAGDVYGCGMGPVIGCDDGWNIRGGYGNIMGYEYVVNLSVGLIRGETEQRCLE